MSESLDTIWVAIKRIEDKMAGEREASIAGRERALALTKIQEARMWVERALSLETTAAMHAKKAAEAAKASDAG